MSQIIQKLRDVDPNDSDAVKEVLNAFFQNLLKYKEVNCNTWLRLLEDVITRFPRYCSQHRKTIEKYLVHFLDSTYYYNVIEAAKCAHGLQQIRPCQDKAATPKNCWREQMIILCDTAHSLIEAIFSNTVVIYKKNSTVKKNGAAFLANTTLTSALSRILNSNKSQNTSAEKKTILVNKLRNIFVFIQAMLVEVYPVGKPIQPQLILQVIVPTLSFSSSSGTNPADASILMIEAFRTLDALIACLGKNLIPFSALIIRFVMQTLRWSMEKNNEESRKVRCVAYKSLSLWLSILHVHRVADAGKDRSWEDELAENVLEDIAIPEKIVKLTINKQPTKNLSKKAKRKLVNSQLDQSALTKYMPGEKNQDDNMPTEERDKVAMAALECAEMFLTVCGIFLKQSTHKLFHERLVRECYNVDAYNVGRSIRLLRALDAARKNTAATVPPPTQYCVQLYSTLVNSQCDEVRKFCSQALLDIRLHLHCSPPTLNFSLKDQQGRRSHAYTLQIVTEKNRTALADLLGEQEPELENEEDQEASQPDEPTNKKPRLEDDVDTRISISSESEPAVVIADDSGDEIEMIVEDNREIETDAVVDQENMNEIAEEVAQATESVVNNDMAVIPETPNDDGQMILPSTPESAKIISSTTPNSAESHIVTPPTSTNIHEAKTQVVLNTSTDTIDGDKSPVSMEIAYDLPRTPKKVTFLEKMDDENLPSTNETDDIAITCGQKLNSSPEINKDVEIITKDDQDAGIEVIAEEETNGTKEVNGEGIQDQAGEGIQDQAGEGTQDQADIEVKITSTEVTVDDMMADFVDEVIDEPKLVS